jgi:hypothetical protein
MSSHASAALCSSLDNGLESDVPDGMDLSKWYLS